MPPRKPKGAAVVAERAQRLERLDVSYVAIADIRPNAYNPNRQSEHDFELLCASMREDGFTQPVVALRINEAHKADAKFAHYELGDTVIVDGEHRWRAAAKLTEEGLGGYDPIPVVVVPMTVEQARIATLRHNRARGSEDIGLASDVLRDLRELGALDWAQASLQLDDTELQRLLDDVPAPEALAAEAYSTAWSPGTGESEHGTEVVDDKVGGIERRQAATPAAVEALRQAEQKAAAAHTEEERVQAMKDAQVFRLSLTFAGDEGRLVKLVLGDDPAAKIVAMCNAEAQEASQ